MNEFKLINGYCEFVVCGKIRMSAKTAELLLKI